MRPRLGPWAVFIGLVAVLWHVAGLGEPGFWSTLELPVLARTGAALGESHRELVRSPWLPDAVRTLAYRLWPSEFGLRLPHALASAGLVTIAFVLAAAKSKRLEVGLLAALVAVSMPSTALQGHTVLGNPVFELAFTGAIVLGFGALKPELGFRTRAVLSLAAALCLVLASTSAGAVLGAVLPLAIVASAGDSSRAIRAVLWLIVVLLAVIGLLLVFTQGDGYIPWLGASKDLRLAQTPAVRRFPSVLYELGAGCFPWLGFVAVGATEAKNRAETIWIVLTLCVAGAWSLRYGPAPLPLTVPVAVVCAMAIDTLFAWDGRFGLRERFVVLVLTASLLVARQDAKLDPRGIALPGVELAHAYPAALLRTTEHLQSIVAWVFLALCLGLGLRWRGAPRSLACGGLMVAAAAAATVHAKVLLPRTGQMFSLKHPMQRYETWADSGVFASPLAVHQIQDRGVAIYGPSDREDVRQRHDLLTMLASETPRAALLRDGDLASAYLAARSESHPFFVLDDTHQSVRLVANTLPEGAEDRNRIPSVLFEHAPTLRHPTLVRFGENLELIAWDVDGPLVRGRSHTLRLAFRVLNRLPAGTQIHARFLHGRLARINGEPQPIAEGIYPPGMWRPGDYILHRFTFEVPPLEVVPGVYDFVVGLRRNDHENFEISQPSAEAPSQFGVDIRDKQRQFAKIGQVDVW